MSDHAHPPNPGPVVQPNFLAILESLGEITFPISKRDLLEQVGERTVLMEGQNVDLHAIIKDIHDDFFDDEGELQGALERLYAGEPEDIPLTAGTERGVLSTGPPSSWQPRMAALPSRPAWSPRSGAITGNEVQPSGREQKGKPEAVNLERDEPITTAARRRDTFDEDKDRRAAEHADP